MKRFILCSLMLCSIACATTQNQPSLLIADTYGQHEHNYRNLINMAQNVGFNVQYKNLYDLLQLSDINQYDSVFFMLNPRMLCLSAKHHLLNRFVCALPFHHAHSIPEHCWNLLRSFSKQHDKALAIILPGHINYSEPLKHQAIRTIERLGCFQNVCPRTKEAMCDFVIRITRPDTITGSLFGTSLIPSQSKACVQDSSGSAVSQKTYDPKTGELQSVCTPLNRTCYSKKTQQTFPLGIVVRDDVLNNTLLISKASEFTFADISEHLFKNPFKISDRNTLLRAAQETLTIFCTAHTTNQIPNTVPYPQLCNTLSNSALKRKKAEHEAIQKRTWNKTLYQWMENKNISFAWMDPYDFYAHEDARQTIRKLVQTQNGVLNDDDIKKQIESIALVRGIRLTYRAQFDALWFEFIPEWYLSPHGSRKEQKEEYIERIKKLGTALRAFFVKRNRKLPKLFLGMNLTSNFKTYPVAHPVQDLYGVTYTKIPSPFDIASFWKPEVLDLFDAFITTFQTSLPIDGVFFDLEMYHAPEQAGMYTDLMDFSDTTWRTYCSYAKDERARTLSSVKKRVRYLQQEKKFANYFATLEHASKELGAKIKQYMRKKQPHLIFGVYAPTLPASWFYRGFLAGLSLKSEPILLATFNTDYISHHEWLADHDIHCIHGGALMLSKLKTENDFQLIPQLQTLHSFVWYNRPSRMIYEYSIEQLDSVWWGIEATSYDSGKTMKQIKSYHQG